MPQLSFKTIDSVDVSGKRVLVRVDLNVPMKNGQVTDATRIERAVPTLAELAAKGAKVIVLSHFGRPDGKRVPEMSLKPLVEPLSKALGKPVAFAEDCIGPLAEDAVRALKPGEVLLLENLRFHKEEEKNDPGFIDKLSVLGDIYVNDAFSAAHRAHASTEGLANRLPAAAGRLMQTELDILAKAKAANCKVLLPVDAVVAPEFKANAPYQVVDIHACPDDQMILDVGPESIALYVEELTDCATLVWNGPLGAFEIKPFDAGTVALAEAVARLTSAGKLLSVAGGGDTVAALAAAGVADKFSYVSTAGGAFLEWMEGKTLPGVAALVRAA